MAEKWMKDSFPEYFGGEEAKTGLNKPQIHYMWRVYADEEGITRCHFPIFESDGSWHYCGTGHNPDHEPEKIEVNHILARGFAGRFLNMTPNEIDHPKNLICLCKFHHVGEGYHGDLVRDDESGEPIPIYHIDNVWAKRNYKGIVKPTSFDLIFEQRKILTELGIPYYNDFWTPMMLYIAEEKYWEHFNKTHEPWPMKRKRK